MNLFYDDTIASVATPPGKGALSVIRISGADTFGVLSRVFHPASGSEPAGFKSHTIHYGIIRTGGEVLDEVMVSVMRGPASYTGEDTAEITCHGGVYVTSAVLDAVLGSGARAAMPGEFTMRAFLNGRIDLAQAEAVNQVINARSEKALKGAVRNLKGELGERLREVREQVSRVRARIDAELEWGQTQQIEAFDPTEGREALEKVRSSVLELLEGAASFEKVSEGQRVVICGRPNAGKSSLFNLILKKSKSIVSPEPGTTRDTVEGDISLDGIPLRLSDTAGLGLVTPTEVEKAALEKASEEISRADIIIYVIDGHTGISVEDTEALKSLSGHHLIALINKSDLGLKQGITEQLPGGAKRVVFSCLRGTGMRKLTGIIRDITDRECGDGVMINARQRQLLKNLEGSLGRALENLEREMAEVASAELSSAASTLGEFDGSLAEEDILDRIFSDFCIGK